MHLHGYIFLCGKINRIPNSNPICKGWIGESEENSTTTTQWNLSINGVDKGDIIVESLEEFKQFFKK